MFMMYERVNWKAPAKNTEAHIPIRSNCRTLSTARIGLDLSVGASLRLDLDAWNYFIAAPFHKPALSPPPSLSNQTFVLAPTRPDEAALLFSDRSRLF